MEPASVSPILVVDDLTVGFPNRAKVLDGVSLTLNRGEILGLVGESGSGKSLLAKTLVRLEFPAEIRSGSIMLDGSELTSKTRKEMRHIRGEKIALAMQDPRAAMDPVFRMGCQFAEVPGFGLFTKQKIFTLGTTLRSTIRC